MDKKRYIETVHDPEVDSIEMIHFYYLLQGGKIKEQGKFMQIFTRWLLITSHGFVPEMQKKLAQVNLFVTIKLNEHFGIV